MSSGTHKWTIIRRAVSITGQVTDALTGAPIAGALVEIAQGPPEFQAMLATLASDPGWDRRPERLDRRPCRADGRYAFVGLPVGDYDLRASAPLLGSRYGAATLSKVHVYPATERLPNGRIKLDPADAALSPTRVRGTVRRGGPDAPIARARVRLVGDTNVTLTNDLGEYLLVGLVAGAPTLEVSAKAFVTAYNPITLSAGLEVTLNVVLASAPGP
ncbi:MAG TPA: carboxypeptidase-like regulatory domain-containing protein [Roseiflexaceae bacterium]